MTTNSLRNRILLVGILPVLFASAAVAFLVGSGRARDLEAAHAAQTSILTQQLQVSSQYGLFSGSRSALDSTVTLLMTQPNVLGVALFDADGRALSGRGQAYAAGLLRVQSPAYQEEADAEGRDVIVRKIYSSGVEISDIYAQEATPKPTIPQLLGYGVLEVSRDALRTQTRTAMVYSMGVGLVVALLGALLALRLGRLVMQPVRQLTDNIRRIGAGDFATEAPQASDPLYAVHAQLGLMAERLAWRRQDLELQVQEATQAMRQQRDEAEKANHAKSHFLASASHDLRQPTHAIGLFVASLQQRPLEPQARRIVDYLQQSVHSMQELLDGLLDLSRLDSGTVRLDLQACSVESVFVALRASMGPAAVKPTVRLRVRSTPYWTTTDPALLRQVLINLVQNAVRYTDEGTVLVTCRPVRQGRALRIEVRDSGIGMAPEQHNKVFQEFYQVDNPGRDRGKGMGLGLSIVQRILQLLDHPLTLQSAPGCGSTFAIELPRGEPQSTEAASANAEASTALDAGAGALIFVLEDDPLVLQAISALLSGWGYQVVTAPGFAQAMELMDLHGAPDLLLCDYRLGEALSGLQAIHELRQRAGTSIPACLISGDTDAELMRQAGDQQLPLLHKPIRPAKLRALVRRMLVSPSA